MTCLVKHEEAETVVVIATLLGLVVTMSADYPTTHDYKFILTSYEGNAEISRQDAVEIQHNFLQVRRHLYI